MKEKFFLWKKVCGRGGGGGGGLIKPPQLPGSAVPYSLLPISSLMNPLSTRGLNLRCNFILLYLPQGDFHVYRTPLSGKITLSYRTILCLEIEMEGVELPAP